MGVLVEPELGRPRVAPTVAVDGERESEQAERPLGPLHVPGARLEDDAECHAEVSGSLDRNQIEAPDARLLAPDANIVAALRLPVLRLEDWDHDTFPGLRAGGTDVEEADPSTPGGLLAPAVAPIALLGTEAEHAGADFLGVEEGERAQLIAPRKDVEVETQRIIGGSG